MRAELDAAVADHLAMNALLEHSAGVSARNAPVVDTTRDGRRIVHVDKGYVLHPDDRSHNFTPPRKRR